MAAYQYIVYLRQRYRGLNMMHHQKNKGFAYESDQSSFVVSFLLRVSSQFQILSLYHHSLRGIPYQLIGEDG